MTPRTGRPAEAAEAARPAPARQDTVRQDRGDTRAGEERLLGDPLRSPAVLIAAAGLAQAGCQRPLVSPIYRQMLKRHLSSRLGSHNELVPFDMLKAFRVD